MRTEKEARSTIPPVDLPDGNGSGPVISVHELTKTYAELEAVRRVSFEVAPGEIFGFLGPNGAGKSSTMRMIGAVSPTSGGTLRILGMDPATDGPSIRGNGSKRGHCA